MSDLLCVQIAFRGKQIKEFEDVKDHLGIATSTGVLRYLVHKEACEIIDRAGLRRYIAVARARRLGLLTAAEALEEIAMADIIYPPDGDVYLYEISTGDKQLYLGWMSTAEATHRLKGYRVDFPTARLTELEDAHTSPAREDPCVCPWDPCRCPNCGAYAKDDSLGLYICPNCGNEWDVEGHGPVDVP